MPTRIIDSHTGGEPTRLIVSGGPALDGGSLAEQLQQLRSAHDHWRRAVVTEPRGSDVMVGALLCEPQQPDSSAGVIFFNNVGYLGMCGHGSIGLVASLAYLGRLKPGFHWIETPVGRIRAELHADGRVSIVNVPAYRLHKQVAVSLGERTLHGDIAWGGNWFFLCSDHGLTLSPEHIPALSQLSQELRQALHAQGHRGAEGAEIDHIELLGPAANPEHDGRNFVLCPGLAWDRSPCGTGTSAKLACLAADGELAPGELWQQESVIGSVFEARYERASDGHIIPTISGRAHVNLDAQLVVDPTDPFAWGFSA